MTHAMTLLARVTSPLQLIVFGLCYLVLAAMVYGTVRLARRSRTLFGDQRKGRGALYALLTIAAALFAFIAGFLLVDMTAFLVFWES